MHTRGPSGLTTPATAAGFRSAGATRRSTITSLPTKTCAGYCIAPPIPTHGATSARRLHAPVVKAELSSSSSNAMSYAGNIGNPTTAVTPPPAAAAAAPAPAAPVFREHRDIADGRTGGHLGGSNSFIAGGGGRGDGGPRPRGSGGSGGSGRHDALYMHLLVTMLVLAIAFITMLAAMYTMMASLTAAMGGLLAVVCGVPAVILAAPFLALAAPFMAIGSAVSAIGQATAVATAFTAAAVASCILAPMCLGGAALLTSNAAGSVRQGGASTAEGEGMNLAGVFQPGGLITNLAAVHLGFLAVIFGFQLPEHLDRGPKLRLTLPWQGDSGKGSEGSSSPGVTLDLLDMAGLGVVGLSGAAVSLSELGLFELTQEEMQVVSLTLGIGASLWTTWLLSKHIWHSFRPSFGLLDSAGVIMRETTAATTTTTVTTSTTSTTTTEMLSIKGDAAREGVVGRAGKANVGASEQAEAEDMLLCDPVVVQKLGGCMPVLA